MQYESLGKLIFIIRNKQRATQKEICKGLCDCKDLSKFEHGKRKPDIFLLNALLQRMGTSIDKLDIFISNREYLLFELRYSIEEDIVFGRYEEGKKKLAVFEKYKESGMALHTQFILKIKSLIEQFENKNTMKAIQYAEEALKTTMPDHAEPPIWKARFHLEEIFLQIMICYYFHISGEEELSISELKKLKYYADNYYSDYDEKIKVYPHIVYLLAYFLSNRKELHEMLMLCKECILLQAENGKLSFLPEIMELYCSGLHYIKDEVSYKNVSKQLYYLKEVLYENDFSENYNDTGLFINRHKETLYLIQKAIERNRKQLGISQEKFSAGICTPETLSRIENGKQTPRSVNFNALLEQINRKLSLFSPILESDDFEVLKWKSKIEKLNVLRKYKELKEILHILESNLDNNKIKNKQYILYMETICSVELNEISFEAALDKMQEALGYTWNNYEIRNIKNSYLLEIEIRILIMIAVIQYHLSNKKEAIKILRALLENIKSSSSVINNYFISGSMAKVNLSEFLKEVGALKESIEICNEGIKTSLKNQNITTIDELLFNKACALECMDIGNGGEKYGNISSKYYCQAYYLSRLMHHNAVSEQVKLHYKNNIS